MTTAFEAAQISAHAADPRAPGAWTRAYLTAALGSPTDQPEELASVALLAAVGYAPSLLEPIQARYYDWVDRVDGDGLPGVDAHVVRLAADGLWTADLFNLAPPDPELRARIYARLAELAGGGGER